MDITKKLVRLLRDLNPWHPLNRACHRVIDVEQQTHSVYVDLKTGETLIITLWDSYGLPATIPQTLDQDYRLEAFRVAVKDEMIDSIDYCEGKWVEGSGTRIEFSLCHFYKVTLTIPHPEGYSLTFTVSKTRKDLRALRIPPCKPPKQ